MKKYFILAVAVILTALTFNSYGSENLPPKNLSYERIWTDKVRIQWNSPSVTDAKADATKLPWKFQSSFRQKLVGSYPQQASAADGQFIYTASWNTPGMFVKYDMFGAFVEEFFIDKVQGIRDLTFDGEFFYGGAEGIYRIYKLDLKNKKLISSIPVEFSVRHICYIPTLDDGRGGFEAGDYNTSAFLRKDGTKIKDGLQLFMENGNGAAYGTAYSDGKIYAFQQLMGSGAVGSGKQIYEYDAETGVATGKMLDFMDYTDIPETMIQKFHMAGGLDIVEYPKGRKIAIVNFQGQIPNPIALFEVSRIANPEELTGYNIYRDGVKVNAEVISSDNLFYTDSGLQELKDYTYTMKAIYKTDESTSSLPLTVNLPSTSTMPFRERFDSESLKTNYWTYDNEPGSFPAWEIIRQTIVGSMTPSKLLKYVNTRNDGNVQCVVSRPLNAVGREKVFIEYELGMNCYHDTAVDKFIVDLYDGEKWVIVDEILTKKGGMPLELRTKDVSNVVADKIFKVRFRAEGDVAGGFLYEVYIDNLKVWAPEYSDFKGIVKYGDNVISDASVSLVMNDDIIKYDAVTDGNGIFEINDAETGIYTLAVRKTGYNDYIITDFVLENNLESTEFRLTKPNIEIDMNKMEFTLSPDKTFTQNVNITNSGDGDCEWAAEFRFSSPKSDTKLMERKEFDIMLSFNSMGNTETSMVYHNDHIYALSATFRKLFKYTKEGEYVGEIVLPADVRVNQMTKDDNYFYMIGADKIMQYDLASNEYKSEIQLPDYFNYCAYDPISDGFYVGNPYALHLVDRAGEIVETFSISGTSTSAIALDLYSEETASMWLYSRKAMPGQGTSEDNVTLKQFSLSENKLTGKEHSAIDIPGYIAPDGKKRQTTVPAGLCGTTEYCPGKFVLIGGIKYEFPGTPIPNLVYMYDIVPTVTWINIEEPKGSVKAGETSTLKVDFNSFEAKSGDKYEITILLKSKPGVTPIEIPVVMNVDIKADEKCYVPSNVVVAIENDIHINLTWELKDKTGAAVENLLGYNVYRDGKRLNGETLITEAKYTDREPMLGIHNYTVTAVYSFTCESYMSEPATIELKYVGECGNASAFSTEVVNQRHIKLSWGVPIIDYDGQYDDFELYEPFIIKNIGNWDVRDEDGAVTYAFQNAQYPNSGKPMAFIVFNPSKTKPVAPVKPYQGEQVLASFSAMVSGVQSNDWLISPEMTFDKEYAFNFMAKTHDLQYGYEKMMVGYSTTENKIEDFIFFNDSDNSGKPYNVPEAWTEYMFKIPAEAKYVAINSVGMNSFILLLDNIYVGSPDTYFSVDGYNIFKNGEKLNSKPVIEKSFYDFSLADGEYRYQIETLYRNTCVSEKSENKTVKIDYTNKCNPVKVIKADIEDQNVELSWNAPAWSDPVLFKYHNNENADGIGWQDGGDIYAGTKWIGSELTLYDGYSITAIEILINERGSDIIAFVMCDGEILSSQKIEEYNLGEFTTVTFDTPVLINPEKEYIIGYKVTHEAETYPVGCDTSKAVDGKGNLVSYDGKLWKSILAQFGAEFDFNWNITVILEEVGKFAETNSSIADFRAMPVEGHNYTPAIKHNDTKATSHLENSVEFKSIDPILGFNIYKNEILLNQIPITNLSFNDGSKLVGKHKYSIGTAYGKCGEIKSDEILVDVKPINVLELHEKTNIYNNGRNVIVSLPLSTDFTITILSMSGAVVKSQSFSDSSSASITLDYVAAATYIVKLSVGAETITEKVIIN